MALWPQIMRTPHIQVVVLSISQAWQQGHLTWRHQLSQQAACQTKTHGLPPASTVPTLTQCPACCCLPLLSAPFACLCSSALTECICSHCAQHHEAAGGTAARSWFRPGAPEGPAGCAALVLPHLLLPQCTRPHAGERPGVRCAVLC